MGSKWNDRYGALENIFNLMKGKHLKQVNIVFMCGG